MQELEKILEEIEEGTHTFKLFGRDVDFVAIDWVRDIIRKHMNDGWIPVEERMPEKEYDTVLCVTDQNYYFVGVYNQEYGFRTGDIETEGKVVAWRPLPESYQKERST